MKINRSYLLSFFILLAIAIWFIIGGTSKFKSGNTDELAPANAEQTADERPSVRVTTITAEPHSSYLNLHGRTEAAREVSVKAETSGIVVLAPVIEGSYVEKGTLLCSQDIDARAAVLDQANAVLRARELDYNAAQTLVDKGFRSSTQAAGALAALDGARAAVKQAEIELGNVEMRAPFGGIFERQIAEIGEYLRPGSPCGLLVDLDPLVIAGDATEKQVGLLSRGQNVDITMATGETVSGKVRLIESKANPATRTFRIEVAVPNKNRKLRAGVSASLRLTTGNVSASLIPANVLTLNDQGIIGVRHLDASQRVVFTVINTIDDTADGMWVTGLPARTVLITHGQDYVSAGTIVRTQYDMKNGASPTRGQP